jgi:hypothetical protein
LGPWYRRPINPEAHLGLLGEQSRQRAGWWEISPAVSLLMLPRLDSKFRPKHLGVSRRGLPIRLFKSRLPGFLSPHPIARRAASEPSRRSRVPPSLGRECARSFGRPPSSFHPSPGQFVATVLTATSHAHRRPAPTPFSPPTVAAAKQTLASLPSQSPPVQPRRCGAHRCRRLLKWATEGNLHHLFFAKTTYTTFIKWILHFVP